MPAPLEIRVMNRVLAEAAEAAGANVPADQQYRRDKLAFDPDRDKVPALVVSRSPGRGVAGPTARLRWNEWEFPVTALLIDTAGGRVKSRDVADDWRADWARTLAEAVGTGSPLNVAGDAESVTEVHYASNDPLTILDLTAFEQAGLWVSAVPFVVTVRVPL
jgi:hypothetical protein